jgi:sulfur relay protein TusC/DsrF
MAKNIVVLVRSCPYGIATAAEAFRAASGLAAMDHTVSVLFVQDGVFTAKPKQAPKTIGMQDISQAYAAIGDVGAKTFILDSCLDKRGIGHDDLAFGEVVDFGRIKAMIDSADVVLNFV